MSQRKSEINNKIVVCTTYFVLLCFAASTYNTLQTFFFCFLLKLRRGGTRMRTCVALFPFFCVVPETDSILCLQMSRILRRYSHQSNVSSLRLYMITQKFLLRALTSGSVQYTSSSSFQAKTIVK